MMPVLASGGGRSPHGGDAGDTALVAWAVCAATALAAVWLACALPPSPDTGQAAAGDVLRRAADFCSTALSRPMFSSAPAGDATGADARPATTVKVLSCEPLPNVPGKSITSVLVDFPPLAHTPAHRHPGVVQAVITQGTVRSQLAGSPAADYRVGQTFFEPLGALHLFADNPDPLQPAQLLATFVADESCGPLVLPERPR